MENMLERESRMAEALEYTEEESEIMLVESASPSCSLSLATSWLFFCDYDLA